VKIFGVVPVRQLFLLRILGYVALLKSFFLGFEPGDVGLGSGDALQIISHGAADELMAEGIESWAGGFVILDRVSDGVYPTVDHARESVFQQSLEVGQR